MSSVNKKESNRTYTHGGAPTTTINSEEQLCRAVMSCLLWEDTHYESGESIADRIKNLIPKVEPLRVAQIAIDARTLMHLRHVPLLIAREMARLDTHKHLVSRLLPEIIQRPDEITEFMAIYWADKKQPLSAQVKKGLATAFPKFNEYSLGKYNQDGKVTLRDVLFLVCPISRDAEQRATWEKLAEKTLRAPENTWEVEISAKGNNKDSWEKLLQSNSLGAMALIRNLRNMSEVRVNQKLVKEALLKSDVSKVLPFRFLAAAQHAPGFESELEMAMLKCLADKEKLPGKTIVIVDVSGSMYGAKISEKSTMDRAKAACALAVLARELCENVAIYATAGNDGTKIHQTKLVPARHGFALSDAIYGLCHPLGGGGIFLQQVMDYVKEKESSADRIIVITDEQDCSGMTDAPSRANAFGTHNYIVNVNTYKNGIGYGKWTHINGWSEAILDYIRLSEEGFRPKEISQALIVEKIRQQNIPVGAEKGIKKNAQKRKFKKANRDTGKNVSRDGGVRKKLQSAALPVRSSSSRLGSPKRKSR